MIISNPDLHFLNAWFREAREIGPVAKGGRVTSNADIFRHGWGRPIEDPELEPSRRTDFVVGGGRDGAGVATARDSWEDGSLAHTVTMGAGHDAEQ